MARRGRVRIGTSGWVYRHWRGVVYPEKLAARRWLEHFARMFDTVEINNSFYRLPSAENFRNWASQVPPGFVFAVKAYRLLTHMKKLDEPDEVLERILASARELDPHLGPVLYQLPPSLHVDLDRLRRFLELLPEDITHVIEFRHSSWYTHEVKAALNEHGVSFCVHDLRNRPTPLWVTGRAAYIRFHGPTERAYAGRYSTNQLRTWAARMDEWRTAGHDVYVYFNNDNEGYAALNAGELRSMLGLDKTVPPRPARRTLF